MMVIKIDSRFWGFLEFSIISDKYINNIYISMFIPFSVIQKITERELFSDWY